MDDSVQCKYLFISAWNPNIRCCDPSVTLKGHCETHDLLKTSIRAVYHTADRFSPEIAFFLRLLAGLSLFQGLDSGHVEYPVNAFPVWEDDVFLSIFKLKQLPIELVSMEGKLLFQRTLLRTLAERWNPQHLGRVSVYGCPVPVTSWITHQEFYDKYGYFYDGASTPDLEELIEYEDSQFVALGMSFRAPQLCAYLDGILHDQHVGPLFGLLIRYGVSRPHSWDVKPKKCRFP